MRPDTLTLTDFEPITADQLERLEFELPLTQRGTLLKAQYPDEPERWSHHISKRKDAKIKPVEAWVHIVGDSEFQTIPDPPQFSDGRLVEEHELGELPADDAANGRYYFEVMRQCKRLGRGRIPLTYQLKMRSAGRGFSESKAKIYAHPQLEKIFPGSSSEKIPYPKNDCFLSDYLSDHLGTNVKILETDLSSDVYKDLLSKRRLTISLSAFFALADFLDLFPYERTQKFLLRSVRDGKLAFGRRMKVEYEIQAPQKGGSGKDAKKPVPVEIMPLPLIAVIGNRSYALRFHIVDPIAILGQAGGSLAKFHAIAAVPMSSKSAIPKSQMGFMFAHYCRAACPEKVEAGHFGRLLTTGSPQYLSAANIYEQSPDAFVSYSLGDVETLDRAMQAVADKWDTDLYKALGWGAYSKRIKMTAGSSVHDLVKAGFLKRMEEPMRAIPNRIQFLRDIGCSENEADSVDREWNETGVIPERVQKWLVDCTFEDASANKMAQSNHLDATNAKVLGGRCINLAPHIPSLEGVLCDMDAASCYTKSLTMQQLPFGIPRTIGGGFVRDRDNDNGYKTLREILDEHGDELVPGLFQIWITCKNLPVPQDFFPTWDKPRAFKHFDKDEVAVWMERQDLVKHFLSEFTDSPLTHDKLQWLNHVASKQTREWILDNAYVTAAAWYQKQKRCKNEAEYIKRSIEWMRRRGGKNTSEVKGTTEVIKKRRNPYWYSVSFEELIIDKFDSERKIHKKKSKAYKVIRDRMVKLAEHVLDLSKSDQDLIKFVLEGIDGRMGYEGGIDQLIEDAGEYEKHPLDELYKLAANTTYGVMVSRFFLLSNPIVGNNVTARVRSFIWYYEKACASMMSITDGGVFDLNRVVYQRRKDRNLNEKALTLLHNLTYKDQHSLGINRSPIGGFEKIYWTDDGGLTFEHKDSTKTRRFKSDQITGPESACEIVDKLTMDHTRLVFGYALDKIDVLNPETTAFQFEAKGLVKAMALQGQSNYYLTGGSHGSYPKGEDKKEMVAMRGIKKSLHSAYVAPFLRQLISNPKAIKRGDHSRVYIQSMILKTGEYAERYESFYGQTFLQPGDGYYKAGLLRECSISGLRFHTHKQFKAWESRHQRMRDYTIKPTQDGAVVKGGQSFESFYLNDDETLNHLKMMINLNQMVLARRYPPSGLGTDHPSVTDFATTKARLKYMIRAHDDVSYLQHEKLSKQFEEIERAYESDAYAEIESEWDELSDKALYGE